jgi:hypothetical protein
MGGEKEKGFLNERAKVAATRGCGDMKAIAFGHGDVLERRRLLVVRRTSMMREKRTVNC